MQERFKPLVYAVQHLVKYTLGMRNGRTHEGECVSAEEALKPE